MIAYTERTEQTATYSRGGDGNDPDNTDAGFRAEPLNNQPFSALYRRYRTAALLLVTGVMMLLSFLWYVPGANHTKTMGEYHVYTFSEFRFNNVIAMYVNHNLDQFSGPRFILNGNGIEYPPLLSMLIRATAGVGVVKDVPLDVYRSGTPVPSTPQDKKAGNAVAYTWLNYAANFFFGLLFILLLANWPGARPWLFALSPLLFLFAGYNWDIIPIAISLAGVFLLRQSILRPDPGRDYNRWLEIAGYAALAVGIWFKLFPVVFLAGVLVQRARQKQWKAIGLGLGVVAALTLIINVPVALANFDSWYFFLWMHQNRPTELSIWYWLLGGMDPATAGRPDVTATINLLSLLLVGSGGLLLTFFAWKSPRRDIVMPLAAALLVWWLTFNKVYDPNFDIWVLFVLVALGVPTWLYMTFTLVSLNWWLVTFIGLHLALEKNTEAINAWFLSHASFLTLMLRLASLAVLIVWSTRELLRPETETEEEYQIAPARVTAPAAAPSTALQQGA